MNIRDIIWREEVEDKIIYFLLKSQNTALIVTAREMTTKEIRAYGKRK